MSWKPICPLLHKKMLNIKNVVATSAPVSERLFYNVDQSIFDQDNCYTACHFTNSKLVTLCIIWLDFFCTIVTFLSDEQGSINGFNFGPAIMHSKYFYFYNYYELSRMNPSISWKSTLLLICCNMNIKISNNEILL